MISITCAFIGLAQTLFLSAAGAQTAATQPAATTRPATTRPAATQPTTRTSNRVVIETSLGNIVVELTPDRTPVTVENFLRYVDEKFYDETIFHRVIKGFMVQGGGLTAGFREKETHDPIVNESRKAISNERGTIAMARKPQPNSATAQFFINTEDNRRLDYPFGGGYTAFGRVVEGMDVVDKIAESTKENRQAEHPALSDLPVPLVVIKSIHRQ